MILINRIVKGTFAFCILFFVYGMTTFFTAFFCLWDWEKGKNEFKHFKFKDDFRELIEEL